MFQAQTATQNMTTMTIFKVVLPHLGHVESVSHFRVMTTVDGVTEPAEGCSPYGNVCYYSSNGPSFTPPPAERSIEPSLLSVHNSGSLRGDGCKRV